VGARPAASVRLAVTGTAALRLAVAPGLGAARPGTVLNASASERRVTFSAAPLAPSLSSSLRLPPASGKFDCEVGLLSQRA